MPALTFDGLNVAPGQLRTAWKAEIFLTLLIGCVSMEIQLPIKLSSRNSTLRYLGCADSEKSGTGMSKKGGQICWSDKTGLVPNKVPNKEQRWLGWSC